jgi:hypothetical protein
MFLDDGGGRTRLTPKFIAWQAGDVGNLSALHPKVARIALNLACDASVTSRIEQAEVRLRHAIKLDKDVWIAGGE